MLPRRPNRPPEAAIRVAACAPRGHGTSDMRLDRHQVRAVARSPATPRARPGRALVPQDAMARRALPAVFAGMSAAGSALTVLALYWLVAHDRTGISSPHFGSDVALLTGVVIAACGAPALMVRRNQAQGDEIARLEMRLEDFSDRAWEVKEAEDRAKSFLEAQGDVIIRRDSAGCVTYVNDAFCKLAGRTRDELIGSRFVLPVVAQGELAVLADGTRVHDQKIAATEAPRWIAWRDVMVRADTDVRTET